MGHIKRIAAMVILLSLTLSGCGGGSSQYADGFKLYYINQKQSALMPISYELSGSDTDSQIKEVLDLLKTPVSESDHTAPISDEDLLRSFSLKGKRLTIVFESEYLSLSPSREVLLRSAVVKSLVQLDGVDSVTFKIGDDPFTDQAGNVVGAMTDESFVYDFGAEQGDLETAELKLYYPNEAGDALIGEIRRIHYNGNIPTEQLVLKYLTMPPQTMGARAAFSDSSKVLSVTSSEGICYLNLDDTVFTNSDGVSRNIIIYSVVNSLCELDGVGQVEIMTGTGENASVLPGPDGSDLYQADLTLVSDE